MTSDAASRSVKKVDPLSMTASEFETALRELAAGALGANANVDCMACERCERCRQCTFCIESKGLARSHYCVSCDDCVDCSHCKRCSRCSGCQHCLLSDACVGCAYLVRSMSCSGCTYCFGCVGLTSRDFCILNKPYDRSTYFQVAARLGRELRIALP